MIRAYRPDDLDALRQICVLTGDAGRDATGQWSDDGLLPDVFLEPYLVIEPSTAWVVEQDDRPVGYLVATLDTRDFVRRWRQEWSPVFAARHPRAAPDPGERWLHVAGVEPEHLLNAHTDAFPAHLHIDLLPAAQGRGAGRALMRGLGRAAISAGVAGVHLGVGRSNTGALAFYDRLGFRELSTDDSTTWLGIAPGQLA
ncbi:ribosomal protein S18 acetylase RimI-like enzyme [Salinibacterium sp. CAN_S4]|uniref:GNAT family N-acetyltransferase n=1 Tax=Salinibacterium sp. CAN_S4 TaxID=2787727 RepID=UPI0018F01A33